MPTTEEFQSLMANIFEEKVQRARAEKQPGVLSLEGLALFEDVFLSIQNGARHSLPHGASEAEIAAEVRRRLEIKRKLDEDGHFRMDP